MSRYIDADAIEYHEVFEGDEFVRVAYGDDIDELPTVDAVEVVRCKNCSKKEYCRASNVWAVLPSDDWFCADGKRREDGE